MPEQNVYANAVTGATANPLMPRPGAADEQFVAGANAVLANAVELVRGAVGAHQSAAAVMVNQDFSTLRKFFSLSEKYAAWAHYTVSAVGYGTHAWLLRHPATVRFTQEELEAHPAWEGFGTQAPYHPPMRGWLAAPIIGSDGTVWGLIQLSDRYAGDFTADDEDVLERLTQLVSAALQALWDVRNLGGTPG